MDVIVKYNKMNAVDSRYLITSIMIMLNKSLFVQYQQSCRYCRPNCWIRKEGISYDVLINYKLLRTYSLGEYNIYGCDIFSTDANILTWKLQLYCDSLLRCGPSWLTSVTRSWVRSKIPSTWDCIRKTDVPDSKTISPHVVAILAIHNTIMERLEPWTQPMS